MSKPPYDLPPDIERIVQNVQRAPSVFNTRPWWFQFRPPDHVDLWLRDLGARDGVARARARDGATRARARDDAARARAREYVISCGAALFNLRLAIRMAGHDLGVLPLPDPAYADPMHPPALLASVEIVTGRVKQPRTWEKGLYAAIGPRQTSRQPYSPLPLPIITAMEDAAAQEKGAYLRLLNRCQARKWMRLTAKVDSDPAFNPPFPNFVSSANYGPPPKYRRYPRTRRDFWVGGKRRFERKPQLMALSTDDDGPVDWLQAGQALQRAILTGTQYAVPARHGLAGPKPDELAPYTLSASFLTQPLELADLEGRPRRWPWRWRFHELPQMLMRVGYAPVQSHREPPPKTHMADEWSQPPRQPPRGALPSSDSELWT
jgi:hypothetical protein